MKVTFIGHVSKDVNVVDGKEEIVAGGGIFYGSIAVSCLKEEAEVYTKCAKRDVEIFSEMLDKNVDVHFLKSATTTSIRNVYFGGNSDKRKSEVISLATPFNEKDLSNLDEEFLHVNPLWFGEFPDDLVPFIRKKTKFLAGDAQGFLRNVENGKMVYKDWKNKEIYLQHFDLFKVDSTESKILTGENELKRAIEKIHEMGVSLVLATYQDGVYVYNGKKFYHAAFGKWKLEGRTGRGDTCTAAFITAMNKMNLSSATEFAANITTRKMQYSGPLRC